MARQKQDTNMLNTIIRNRLTNTLGVLFITDTHAVEFDFANKWAESIGQALHYQLMTGKKAMVILIIEEPKKEMVYYSRVKKLGKIHNFDVEYVTTEILNIKNRKCVYVDCKCHGKKSR